MGVLVDAEVTLNTREAASAGTGKRLRRRWIWWLPALLAMLCGFWLVATLLHLQQSASQAYDTVPVSRGDINRLVTATGTVNPELTVIVGSYVSGPITDIRCDYNTVVKAGQICATIDPRTYQTTVSQSSANLSVADAQLKKDEAELAYAKINYGRNLRLKEPEAVSQDTVDIAKNLADQAQAQVELDRQIVEQRKADLSAAQINLEYTNIRSPVDGVVVSRNVTQGQTVAASFQTPTLFLIASDLTRMQVDTNVSESDIGAVKTGQPVTFSVDAFPGRTFEGKITQVRQSPQTVQNVVTFDVVVNANNRDLNLKPGMTASVSIVTEHGDNVLRVPNQALRFEPSDASAASPTPRRAGGNTHHVWVDSKGNLSMKSVVPGISDETYTAAEGGELQVGDRVVIGEHAAGTGGLAGFRFPRT